MNAPVKLAQADTKAASTEKKIVKLTKPADGQAVTIELSYDQSIKVDFSEIANEKIIIVRVGERAVILFDNGSTVTLDPFFDSLRRPLANLEFEFAPGKVLTAQEIAGLVPFTDDQSVLPAAGEGGDPREAGADFNPAIVDAIGPVVLNELLPPEFLPPIEFTADIAPALVFPPLAFAGLRAIVEEDHLGHGQPNGVPGAIFLSEGNEGPTSFNHDTNVEDDFDNDPTTIDGDDDTWQNFNNTTHQFKAQLEVTGGSGNYEFSLLTLPDFNSPTLKSQGDTIRVHVDPVTGVVTGYVDDGSGDLGGGDRVVFTLELTLTGDVTFTIYDQLDHPWLDGQPGDNEENNLDIDFSGLIEVTDATAGQTLTLDNIFLTVIDDVPVLTHKKAIEIVDEDDIKTFQSTGSDPNDGPFPDGSWTGDPPFLPFGPATVYGNLQATVKIGADEFEDYPAEFTFLTGEQLDAALDGLSDLGLKSKGDLLSYQVVGNQLFGFVNNVGGPGVQFGDRVAFILTVNPDGSYKFRLYDQLDHDKPLFGADQNLDLQDAIPGEGFGEDVVFIDFGSLLQASDYDHDSVVLNNKLLVAIRDDIPEVKCEPICLTVDEDDIKTGAPTGSDGTSPNDTAFPDGSWTGSPFNPADSGPATVFGSLAGLFGVVESGADEPLTFSFVVDDGLGEHIITELAELAGLKSKGEAISYDIQGNVLFAYVGAGDYTDGVDRLVFKFTLQPNGNFVFELHDQVDHDPPNDDWLPLDLADGDDTFSSGAEENFDLQDDVPLFDVSALPLGYLIKATDYDGDSVIIGDNFTIKIRDDIPELKDGATVYGVVEEEQNPVPGGNEDTTSGPPDLDNDTPGNLDITTNVVSGASLATLVNVGSDEPGKFAFVGNALLGDPITDKDGNPVESQDLPVTVRSISGPLVDGGGTYRVLTAWNGTDDTFTLKIYENGDWTFTLLTEIDHAFGNNGEDVLELDLSGLVKFTDFDGDSIVLGDDMFTVKVIDDVLVVVDCNLIVNGSFEEGHGLGAVDWNVYMSIPGWDWGADLVPFEIQTGGVGGLAPQDGNALVELDGDTGAGIPHTPQGTPDPNDSNATIQQTVTTVADQMYELTFWYAPRPGAQGDGDSSSMEVLWDGAVVHTIDSSTAPAGWQQITLYLTAADASTVLGFRGTGEENEFGAFIDNVSLCPIGSVDEDGLDTIYSTGIGDVQPGDIPGNNTVATGDLMIQWGADDGDAADAGGTQDGALTSLIGRNVVFSSADVEIEGVAQLKSHGDDITFVLDENGTKLLGIADQGGEDQRTVIEVKLLDDGSGSYRFELFDQLDDAPGQDENDIVLGFEFAATDFDGDQAEGHFKVLVDDDLPIVIGEVCPEVGGDQEPGKIANFVFVLDASRSVEDQFALLQDAANNLLDSIGASGAEQVRVHVVQFQDSASVVGTYDLIVGGVLDNAALTQAKTDISNLTDGGFTNYEAGLQEALLWIQGGTKTIAVTDLISSPDANGAGEDGNTRLIGNGTTQIALVSGWNAPGSADGDLINANGSTGGGWGPSPSFFDTINTGELLRFDFGTFDDFDVASYTDAGTFTGIPVTSATFRLEDENNFGSTNFSWIITFTDGNTENGSENVSNSDETVTLAGAGVNDGKEIAHIQFTVTSGEGQVDLESVGSPVTPGTLPDADVNELIFISDGEPNRAVDDNGNIITVSVQNAIDQITGVDDSSDEIGETEGDADPGNNGPGEDQAFHINAYGVDLQNAVLTIDGADDSNTDINLADGLNTGGSNDDDSVRLFSGSTQVALVSGWSSGALTTGAMVDANGGTGGIGVDGGDASDLDGSEVLRFDFGAGDDYDGVGNYTTNGFNGPAVTSATFRFEDEGFGTASFSWTIHFVNALPGTATETGSESVGGNGEETHVIAGTGANAGKEIAYIEFTMTGGEGQVDLQSVVTTSLAGLDVLNEIDSDGAAINVTAPGDISTDLNTILLTLTGGGGGGGDVVNFDLGPIVDPGADEDVTFSWKTDFTPLEDQNLKSGGVDLIYELDGDTLIAHTGDPNNPVFTVLLNDDGTGTFSLVGTLDDTDGTPDGEIHVDFSGMVLAVDFDFDPAVFGPETFCFEIETGTPLDVRGFGGVVEEDELSTLAVPAASFDGNEDADDAGGFDTDNAPAIGSSVSGDFAGTVVGGDGTYVFSINPALVDGSTVAVVGSLDPLKSQGETVIIDAVGNIVYGFVDDDGDGVDTTFDNGDRLVFTFEFDPAGGTSTDWLFTLFDNVDHPTPTANSTAADEENIVLDLQDYVFVDDESGQTALIDGLIRVIDDVPLSNLATSTQNNYNSIVVELDETVQPDGNELPGFDRYNGDELGEGESLPTLASNGGADDVDPDADDDVYNRTPVVATNPNADQAIGSLATAAGGLKGLFFNVDPSFGADGPADDDAVVYDLKFVFGGGDTLTTNLFATDTGNPLLTALSDAERAIYLFKVSDTVVEGRLVGADGPGGDTSDEYVAFRLTLNNADNPDLASITVDHFLAIDHDLSDDTDPAIEDPSVFDENIVLKLLQGQTLGIQIDVTATDGDGDSVSKSATATLADVNGSFVSFDDDGPLALNDTDSVGTDQSTTGNVITGADTTSGAAGADHLSTDGTKVISILGYDDDFDDSADGSGNYQVTGQFGTLEINEDGSYTYTRNTNSAGTDVFTYTLEDGDGDREAATLTIDLDLIDIPFEDPAEFVGIVEEEHLNNFNAAFPGDDSNIEGSTGNEDFTSTPDGDDNPSTADGDDDVPGTPDDFDVTTDVTSGQLTISGGNGTLTWGYEVADGTPVLLVEGPGIHVTSKGALVYYVRDSVDPNILYGVANDDGDPDDLETDDRIVFKIELDPSDGSFVFTLLDQIDHHPYDTIDGPPPEFPVDDIEGIMTIDLGGVFNVDDSDGINTDKHVFQNVAVKVIDDIPEAFTPQSVELENSNGSSGTAFLDIDEDVDDNVGADEPGTITFANIENGQASGLTSGDQPILLFLVDNDANPNNDGTNPPTLEGRIGGPAGTLIFTIVLNHDAAGDDSYTVTMSGTIDNFALTEFPAVSTIPAGNADVRLFENFGSLNLDVLFSSADGTINSSGSGVGIGSQSIGFGDRLNIDFLKNGTYADVSVDGPGDYQTVNSLTITATQNNPGGNDADMLIRAFDADGNEVQITGIIINSATLVGDAASPDVNADNIDDDGVPSNDAEGPVTAVAIGLGFELHGVGGGTNGSSADDDTITIIAAGGFSRVEITNIGGDGSGQDTFDLSFESVSVQTTNPIELAVDVELTDADGDSIESTLDITLNPVAPPPNLAPTDIVFSGNTALTAVTNTSGPGADDTEIAGGSTLFTLSTVDPDDASGFIYTFSGSATHGVNVDNGGAETFTMNAGTGAVTTTSLDYDNGVQTITITTPRSEDPGGNQLVETVTLRLGTNNLGDTIDGSATANDQVIYGFGGSDNLTGGSGNDWIGAGAGSDTVTGGGGADVIDLAGDTTSTDVVRFTAVGDYGDTINNFDALGPVQDRIDFTGALNTLFDDVTNDNNFQFNAANGAGDNSDQAVNLDTTIEALILDGSANNGVLNVDLLDADAVAAEFSAEFSITASATESALLVINDTDGNSASIWQYTESTGAAGGVNEISGTELTFIGLVNSNAAITTGNLDLA